MHPHTTTGRTTNGLNISSFRGQYRPPPFKVSEGKDKVVLNADFSKIEERMFEFLDTGTMPRPPTTWPSM